MEGEMMGGGGRRGVARGRIICAGHKENASALEMLGVCYSTGSEPIRYREALLLRKREGRRRGGGGCGCKLCMCACV